MGRWRLIDDFGKVVDTGVTNIYCQSNASAEAAKMLHNADCDAYEARIAELELKLKQGADYFSELMSKRDFAVKNLRAELARVKAESLVPVPDGDACEYGDSNCDLMTVDGVLVGFDGCGCPIWLHGESEDKCLFGTTIVQPVRLVRLEDVG